MDGERFDAFARAWATGSRRRLLRLLGAGVAAAVVGMPKLAEPERAGAQSGDDCSPDDPPCRWPETTQVCCAGYLGYVCTANKVCCKPEDEPCGGSPGTWGCCCSRARGERCNPNYSPGSGGSCCIATKLKITKLKLNDIDDKALAYLSAADHTYFSGNTRVHGTITVVGARRDKLEDVTLEVLQGGSVVATANLASSVRSKLLTKFGSDEKIAITKSRLLFELPAAQAANVDGSADDTLTLRVRARSRDEGEVTRDFGAVELLVRYTASNRYGGRDGGVGGDDWVKPSVKEVLEHFSGLTWGDMSNMNGGKFNPHKGHRNGQEADGWFSGFNARDAATAETIIDHLNDPDYGSRITRVFVTYSASPCDAFCNAIKGVTLNDGRAASAVIRPVGGHTTHFHWNVSTS